MLALSTQTDLDPILPDLLQPGVHQCRLVRTRDSDPSSLASHVCDGCWQVGNDLRGAIEAVVGGDVG